MKIIGMIHLKALPGYPQHRGMNEVIDQALIDARLLQAGGVDAIMIENTDDDPHQKQLGAEGIAAFTLVASAVRRAVSVPLGFCVLWNDYKAGLAIAKVVGAQFVRVPVFTEGVMTSSGIIEGNPYDVISYRDKIHANDVKILADVQVKHAAMLAKRPIEDSAAEAIHFGADEIIITGRFTGDSPIIDELAKVRARCKDAYLVIGSGTTPENLAGLAKYADAAIVGTYFKPLGQIDPRRVEKLVRLAREL